MKPALDGVAGPELVESVTDAEWVSRAIGGGRSAGPGPAPAGLRRVWRMPSCALPRGRHVAHRDGGGRSSGAGRRRARRDETCRSLPSSDPTRLADAESRRRRRGRLAAGPRVDPTRRTRRSSWTPSGVPPKHRPPQGRARETETPPHSYRSSSAMDASLRGAAPSRPSLCGGKSPGRIQRRGSDGLVVVRANAACSAGSSNSAPKPRCALLAPICEAVSGPSGLAGTLSARSISRRTRLAVATTSSSRLLRRAGARGVAGEPGSLRVSRFEGHFPNRCACSPSAAVDGTVAARGLEERLRALNGLVGPRESTARGADRSPPAPPPRPTRQRARRTVASRRSSLASPSDLARALARGSPPTPRARGGETLHGRWQVSLREVTPEAAKGAGRSRRGTSTEDARVLLPYVWPADKPNHRARVVGALSLLVTSKLFNVGTPFLFKYAVDALAVGATGAATGPAALAAVPAAAVAFTPAAMLAGYGVSRAGASFCNELRNATFAKVAQASIRGVALRCFQHLHELDLDFHLARQTGAVTRTIERGTRGIQFILNSMVFNVVPTALEIALVSYVLGSRLGPEFAALTVGTIGTYGAFTLAVTQWRTAFRKDMNRLENQAGNRSLDSLLNYETAVLQQRGARKQTPRRVPARVRVRGAQDAELAVGAQFRSECHLQREYGPHAPLAGGSRAANSPSAIW